MVRFIRRVHRIFFLAGVLFFSGLHLLPADNNLRVEFVFTSVSDTTRIRDLSAGFPAPVMSLITVRDERGRYIHGLADTTRWLGPHDRNESGRLVDSAWAVIHEYHEEDPSYPPNPDVKDMVPPYWVTEVLDVEGYGLSVMLTMDYSGSMGDDIFVAEDASRTFVRQMSPNDEAAFIKFTGKVNLVQEFTRDTTKLMEAVMRQPDDRDFTALYDAVYSSVTEVLPRQGRRVVVAYTDGKDNYSSHSVEDVVTLAKDNDIPVYMIGLGLDIEPDKLDRIASETGGVFWAAPTAEDLAAIYLEILKLIRGYYVLAHTSTDPWKNGTWRIVDLYLDSDGMTGSGRGRYFVPFVRPNLMIEKQVVTDSVKIAGPVTLPYAMAGDTVLYEVHITNTGRGAAPNVRVADFLADSMDVITYLVPPDTVFPDSAVWQFMRIEPGERISMRYLARLRSVMPMGETPLASRARVFCAIDSAGTDKEAGVTLYGLGLPDLTVRCLPPAAAASPGFAFPLSAWIFNLGNAHAVRPFTVGYYLSDESRSFATDTIPRLMIGDSVLTEIFHVFPSPGIYRVRVIADDGQVIAEIREDNNIDSCRVEAAIDSLWARFSDYTYTETIRDVPGRFYQTIFMRLQVGDQNHFPVHGLASTDAWLGPDDPAGTGQTVSAHWRALRERRMHSHADPADVHPTLRVTEITEDPVSLLLAVDFSSASAGSSVPLRTAWNTALDGFREADAAAVYDLNTRDGPVQTWTSDRDPLTLAVERTYDAPGRPLYDALSRAVNAAALRTGRQGIIAIPGGPDDGGGRSMASLADQARESGAPLFLIDLAGGSDSLKTLAIRSGGMYLPLSGSMTLEAAFDRIHRQLRNYYVLSFASPDTIQDRSRREISLSLSAFNHHAADTGFYRAPLGPADLRIQKTATGRVRTLFAGDSLWQVQAGDSIHYRLLVRNAGHQDVHDFEIRDRLPGNLIYSRSNPVPVRTASDTVFWSIPSLPIGGTLDVAYTCFVDTLTENRTTLLINRAEILAALDTIHHNNTASDTVLYVPLAAAELSVRKTATGDSLAVAGRDTLRYIHAGGLIRYTTRVRNSGEQACTAILFEDVLPGFITLEDPPSAGHSLSGDTLRWTSGRLESRGGTVSYTYTCRVDTLLPPWSVPLVNVVSAACSGDENSLRTTDSDTVWTVGLMPPDPEIRVAPALIQPTDTVRVEVWTPVHAVGWDLVLFFEDGSRITDYADDFIRRTTLTPGNWTAVHPAFGDTRMRTGNEQERVGVIFQTEDIWGVVRADTAWFVIQSSDEFYLEENLFRPGAGPPQGFHFKLSSNRWATVTVYDVSGGFVRKVASGPYQAGWNTEIWDGRDESGRQVGSGLYVAVLISGAFREALKFILIR